jgi:hypothetical protein
MNKKLTFGISSAIAALLFAVLPAVASQNQTNTAPNTVNFTGKVSCSKFGASTPSQKGMSQSMAIQQCISQGYTYVLVVGKRVYPLEGDHKELAKMVGQTVTVAGHLNAEKPTGAESAFNGTLEATTIKPSSN